MAQGVDYMKRSAELFKKLMKFNHTVKEGVIEEKIRGLVSIMG